MRHPVREPTRMLVLVLATSACDATFSVAPHDLGPFRIAAMGVQNGQAEAAIWSGLGLYHDTAPHLSWTLDGAPLGEGWGLSVPDSGELGLVATAPDGTQREGQVSIAQAPAEFTWQRYTVDLGSQLDIASRQAAEATPIDSTVVEGEARIQLDLDGDTQTVRWMTALGQGTLLELDPSQVDLLAEEVLFDDGEVVSREPGPSGRYHLLALAIDGNGSNRWAWIDIDMHSETPVFHHHGRLLSGTVDTSTRLVAGTIRATEDIAGIELIDLESVTGLSQQDALPCGPPETAFALSWLAEGRCTRPELIDLRVVVEVH